MFEDGALGFWLALLMRMAVSAAIVVLASFVVERSGPFVGALTASVPIPAGGAYIILALEHEPDYVAASAVGSLAAMMVNAGFGVTYSALAQRHGLLVSIGGALGFWLAGSFLVSLVPWTIGPVVLLNIVLTPIALYLSRAYRIPAEARARGAIRRSDLFWRAATVSLFLGMVSVINYQLGSFGAGIFSVFPAIMTSLVIILQPRIGGKATASLMAHLQATVPGLAFGILSVYLAAPVVGSWWALAIAFVVCMFWNALLLAIEQRAASRRMRPV
jgi:hypothetical protein